MFNKLYEKIKNYIKENKIELIVSLFILVFFLFPLPFYIQKPGGLIEVGSRIEIDNSDENKGSFNMTYVTEMKATPITYFLALVFKDWDIKREEEMVIEGQSIEELYYYSKLLLKQGNNFAKVVAYKEANLEYEITSNEYSVVLVDKDALTDLKVGDTITHINDNKLNDYDEITEFISNSKVGDKLSFRVINDDKEYTRYGTLRDVDGKTMLGVSILENIDVKTNPNCNISFKSDESGPSGGLITTLQIYDKLVEGDLTKGKKISGTGTIELDGTVGSIGGVKYKILGAEKKKADVFLVPAGENYEEAIRIKNERNLDIEVVSIEKFADAISYLNNLN